MSEEFTTKSANASSTAQNKPGDSTAVAPGAGSSSATAALRSMSFGESQRTLAPAAHPTSESRALPNHEAVPPAPVMRDRQQNPAPTAGPSPVAAVTGEVVVQTGGSDVANQALDAMRTGTPIEQNTRTRVVRGLHKLAYLEDLAVDPNSTTLLNGWGYSPAQYTVKLDPWTGARMIVQNNAAGFATGQNIVGARAQSLAFWRTTLLCHEVNHIIHGDEAHAANSFERYAGEFRAYWVAGYHTVADEADRARQIRAHILRDYPGIRARYDAEADFKARIDGHTRPAAADNLDNRIP